MPKPHKTPSKSAALTAPAALPVYDLNKTLKTLKAKEEKSHRGFTTGSWGTGSFGSGIIFPKITLSG